jgi:polyphosphate kinase
VGRWLEHSRIYFFGTDGENGAGPIPAHSDGTNNGGVDIAGDLPTGGQFYIGSADMMPRNLDRRVEVIVPVTDGEGCQLLREVLAVELADDALAWELRGDGTWEKVATTANFNAQRYLQDKAVERARRHREPDPLNPLGRGVG